MFFESHRDLPSVAFRRQLVVYLTDTLGHNVSVIEEKQRRLRMAVRVLIGTVAYGVVLALGGVSLAHGCAQIADWIDQAADGVADFVQQIA